MARWCPRKWLHVRQDCHLRGSSVPAFTSKVEENYETCYSLTWFGERVSLHIIHLKSGFEIGSV